MAVSSLHYDLKYDKALIRQLKKGGLWWWEGVGGGWGHIHHSSSSWWSLGLEDDIICASYMWVREWLHRPILGILLCDHSGNRNHKHFNTSTDQKS